MYTLSVNHFKNKVLFNLQCSFDHDPAENLIRKFTDRKRLKNALASFHKFKYQYTIAVKLNRI